MQEDSLPTELSGRQIGVVKAKKKEKSIERRKKVIQNPYFKNIRIHKRVGESIIEYVYVLICTCVCYIHM